MAPIRKPVEIAGANRDAIREKPAGLYHPWEGDGWYDRDARPAFKHRFKQWSGGAVAPFGRSGGSSVP
jgi:hypothetical protein